MGVTVIRAGTAVQSWWNVYSFSSMQAVVYDPPTAPVITIYDPTGMAQVTNAIMTKVRTGTYTFIYITPSNGTLGFWTAIVNVTDSNSLPGGSVDDITPSKYVQVFQLV